MTGRDEADVRELAERVVREVIDSVAALSAPGRKVTLAVDFTDSDASAARFRLSVEVVTE